MFTPASYKNLIQTWTAPRAGSQVHGGGWTKWQKGLKKMASFILLLLRFPMADLYNRLYSYDCPAYLGPTYPHHYLQNMKTRRLHFSLHIYFYLISEPLHLFVPIHARSWTWPGH